jgi:hypothetical protein
MEKLNDLVTVSVNEAQILFELKVSAQLVNSAFQFAVT